MSLTDVVKKILDQNSLTEDKRKVALQEAERLADIYKDIKPERYILPENHLFRLPPSLTANSFFVKK
jgi:hypothetical protein